MNELKRKEREEDFIKDASVIHKEKYRYNLVYFVNKTTKVKIICPEHGVFEQTPKNHLNGQGCPVCGKIYAREWRKGDYRHFLNTCVERFNSSFKYPHIVEEYTNSHSKITIVCDKCGNTFNKIACDHITSNDGGCIQCRKGRRIQSNMERRLAELLDEYGISYHREKTFDWLKHKLNLYLDFYISDYGMAIECQGRQHYEPVDFAGRGIEWAENELKIIRERDKAKKKLCEEHNITIIYLDSRRYYNDVELLHIIDEWARKRTMTK